MLQKVRRQNMTTSQTRLLRLLLSTLSIGIFRANAFCPLSHVTRPTSSSAARSPSRATFSPLKYRDRDDHDNGELLTDVPTQTQDPMQVDSANSSNVAVRSTGVQMPIIRTIAISQVVVLIGAMLVTAAALRISGHPIDLNSIHWNGNDAFFSPWDFHLTPMRVLEGFLAAIPMIYLGSAVEKSDHGDASKVNFSTTNMVMTLFGRRKHANTSSNNNASDHPALQPETPMLHALFISIGLAAVTGLSEEIVFRGVIPAAILHWTQSIPMALVGQALLFGFGHLSAKATAGENKVVSGFQAANGLWHGTVYLLSGGDVLPCIIAHALYDAHVFVETWMRINSQMDYTDSAVLKKLSPVEENEIRRIKLEAGPSLTAETLAFARRFFYAFDYEHRGGLTKSDVQRAVTYAFLHDSKQPSQSRVSELFERMLQRYKDNGIIANKALEGRLRLPEFLRVLFLLKAMPEEVPN